MKKVLLLLTTKSIVLLGLTFQSGYSMDGEEIQPFGLPGELVKTIIQFCPKTYYNELSVVCKEFLLYTNELTKNCSLKIQCRFREGVDESFLERFINLTSLNLTKNTLITNYGLARLTNLTSLDITDNYQITDEGIQGLTNLISLIYTDNDRITAEAIQSLTNLKTCIIVPNEFR